MEEEVLDQQDEPVEEPKATRGRRAKKEQPPQASALRVRCTDRVAGTLFDHEHNVRVPPHTASEGIKIPGPVREGSWLDCQIKAGLVKATAVD